MTIGSKLPPDLNPISSEEFRRARKADYDRTLRRQELERMADSRGHGRAADPLRTIGWTLGPALAGFAGVALGDLLALGSLVFLMTVLAAGVAVGLVVQTASGRNPGLRPPVGLAIGVASVGPVYLLIGHIPFLGDAWFVAAGISALIALLGYVIGRWLRARRAG